VEEELLLVDPSTWQVTAVAPQVLGLTQGQEHAPDPALEAELHQQQIELATPPVTDLDELRAALVRRRREAKDAAARADAVAVATPTPVVAHLPGRPTPRPRYRRIMREFGEISAEALVCGMHVHVRVDGKEEAVAVIDRVQPWLPVVLALSANSPFWAGSDTGHASWRSQVWARWPTGGAHEAFGSWQGYREVADTLESWGAALDDGMLYYDIRVAKDLPTVEVRVMDVCTDVDDAVLVAALVRALVTTVAAEHEAGVSPPEGRWRADLLRAAQWRAGRDGISGDLVHPMTRARAGGGAVARALVDRVATSLEESGERRRVDDLMDRLLHAGGGAGRQRAVPREGDDVAPVLADLARRTHAA